MNQWQPLARAVAAHGLVGATLAMPDGPAEPHAWTHLLATVTHERITGLLVKALLDGVLPATPEQAREAQLALRASMAAALALEATLVRTARVLETAGVDYRVLKGPGVAHLDYPDPALRSFGDIDLLIPASQFDQAIEALAAVGHQRKFPEPRAGFDRRFGKGSCLVGPDGDEIDLHRTLALGPFGLRLVVEDLWRRSSTFELAGRQFRALGPEERFLHACFHSVLGDNPLRLASLRDVAQMHLTRPLDVDETRRLSSRWAADAVVARAVGLATAVLGLSSDGPLSQWAEGFSPSRRDRHFLSVYTGTTPNYAAMSFAALRAIPRVRDKAAFAWMLAAPRRRYLEQRGEQPAGRWRRAVSQIRSTRRSR